MFPGAGVAQGLIALPRYDASAPPSCIRGAAPENPGVGTIPTSESS